MERATFAAGCFWGVEESFRTLDGVLSTEVGYTGGLTDAPTYEEVCTNTTGHAEAVRIEFDPKIISYEELVDHFWKIHDPTQLNRQGPDIGEQYRSVIFYHNDKQKDLAEKAKEKIQESFSKPIATRIEPAVQFYPAEDHHQKYLMKKNSKSCSL